MRYLSPTRSTWPSSTWPLSRMSAVPSDGGAAVAAKYQATANAAVSKKRDFGFIAGGLYAPIAARSRRTPGPPAAALEGDLAIVFVGQKISAGGDEKRAETPLGLVGLPEPTLF